MKKVDSYNRNVEEIQDEVKKVLAAFQEGYSKRDSHLIDDYAKLISKDSRVFAVGTGDNEWCFGWEEIKELIESDWKYWGDFTIDLENVVISSYGNKAWFMTHATVGYEFEDSNERYGRYLETAKAHFEANGNWKDLSPMSKLTNINYLLASLMGNRKEEKRYYRWPAIFSGVLVREGSQWLFQYMQFSMSNPSRYPDIRFNDEEAYEESFKALKDKMVAFKENHMVGDTKAIDKILKEFEGAYLEEGYDVKDIVMNFFDEDESIQLIGTDACWYKGKAEIEGGINHHRQVWDEMSLDIAEALIDQREGVAWFATNGIAKKTLSQREACESEIKALKHLFDEETPAKDKIFRIQRDISILMKELAKGEDFVWPFRLEGVLVKRENKWFIHTLQFSYPFMMILEGKYD